MKAFCVIVTYNGIKWIDKCLKSILTLDYTVEVIVVDNCSEDGTREKIRKDFPMVYLIELGQNIGFGKANNIGIKKAIEHGAEYIFLLNQDAYIKEGSMRHLIETMEMNSCLGIISPLHYAGVEGQFDYKFYKYIDDKATPGFTKDLKSGILKDFYITEFINATAWLISYKMLKITGLFHPIFFQYSEDMEFIHRMKNKGFQIAVSPKLSVIYERPQYEDPPDLIRKMTYFENAMFMNYLVKRRSLFFISSFMILSIWRDFIMTNFIFGLMKIRRFSYIRKQIKKFGNYYYQ